MLVSCSYSDLTDLWPSGEDEEEVVIRELPGDSFDPEDSDEITISKIEADEDMESVPEIDIVDETNYSSDSNEESIDSILSQNGNEFDSESNITDVNGNGKVSPVFTYVGQRITEMENEYNRLNQDIKQGERIGMIRFGSRVDIYFENYDPIVKLNQKTIAGETLLARK